MKTINWLDHLVSLVVVIGGITIAFTLNSWKEYRDQTTVQNQYAVSLMSDLQNDIEDLNSLLHNDSVQLDGLIRLYLHEDANVFDDSLAWALTQLGSFQSFTQHNVTFESLKASGRFESMWELDVRIELLDYYLSIYDAIFDIEEYFQKNFDQNILPYFIDELGFQSDKSSEKIVSHRFKNIVGMQIGFLRQKIEANKTGKASSTHLLAYLEKNQAGP